MRAPPTQRWGARPCANVHLLRRCLGSAFATTRPRQRGKARPRSHAERDEILSALVAYLIRSDADPALVAAEGSLFATARLGYQAARAAYQGALGTADQASKAAYAADAAFDRDLRTLVGSMRDAAGHVTPRTLADRMGGLLPSELTRLPYREEVQRTRDLLSRLEKISSLGLDADRVAALKASVDALETATDQSEAATRAARTTGATLTEAVATFDLRYGKLVRRWQALTDEGVVEAILPQFHRTARSNSEQGTGASSPPATSTP